LTSWDTVNHDCNRRFAVADLGDASNGDGAVAGVLSLNDTDVGCQIDEVGDLAHMGIFNLLLREGGVSEIGTFCNCSETAPCRDDDLLEFIGLGCGRRRLIRQRRPRGEEGRPDRGTETEREFKTPTLVSCIALNFFMLSKPACR